MKEIKIKSTDSINLLNVYIWEPEDKPLGIIQISHGMIEHQGRYDDFAKFMNARGFLVIGNDHLGHGKTAKCDDDLGFFGKGKSKTVVDDLHEITKYAKENYGKDIPYILFGHSMGSFMARRYLMTYGSELSGAILSGTGSQPAAILACGIFLTNLTGLIKGDRHRPALIKSIAFGSYLNRIENPKSKSDWLSRDEKIVEIYDNDKFCTYDFTVNGYKTLFDSISFIQKKSNIDKVPKTLPVLFMSGLEDPVGNYGKGVEQAYDAFYNAGVTKSELVLYHGGRHEMLNEIERESVYEDIDTWIKLNVL